ncbi:MAG: hypothetical protein IH872_04890 [Chloroflexi bacterium]|nr:hypothetical protein [Chloroflexota bacterium]
MWKTQRQVADELRRVQNPSRLLDLFALSRFWKGAVYPAGYVADESWPNLLKTTNQGHESLESITSVSESFGEVNCLQAMFGMFHHHDIFFDWEESDIEGIRNLLSKEIQQKDIRFPHRFGRLLYDSFNDENPGSPVDYLLPEAVSRLLDGTPQGIYQVGNLVSGPFGILTSKAIRSFHPVLDLPLWHCPDIGCRVLHPVSLTPPQIPLMLAYTEIGAILAKKDGPASNGYHLINRIMDLDSTSIGQEYFDIPSILAETLVGSDLSEIMTQALKGQHRDHLMSQLDGRPTKITYSTSAPETIAESLTSEEQLQLLLLLPNESIIESIDDLVDRKSIVVAPGQIRRPKHLPPHSANDPISELGTFGLRTRRGSPIVNLISIVKRAYQEEDFMNDLVWRLGSVSTTSLDMGLATYIRDNSPQESVSKLIFTSEVITKFVASHLGLLIEPGDVNDRSTVDKVLWKLGFNTPQFDNFVNRFKSQLVRLDDTVRAASPFDSEESKELVRSSGVNPFISLETLIDQILAYNVWLLSSDHFVNTDFIFNIEEARNSIAANLGTSLQSDSMRLSWNTDGSNALGVLFRYLHEALDWMTKLSDSKREDTVRSPRDQPHYLTDTNVMFPFKHSALWADSDPIGLAEYVAGFRKLVQSINESNAAFIRNGFDHRREDADFPSSESILSCTSRLRSALDFADSNRYLPKVFWLQRKTEYGHGTSQFEMRDYAGKSIIIEKPSIYTGLPEIGFGMPYLIAPGNLLGSAGSEITFRNNEPNSYDKYWAGYPRRAMGISQPNREFTEDDLEPLIDDNEGNSQVRGS